MKPGNIHRDESNMIDTAVRSLVQRINGYGIPIASLARMANVSRNTIYALLDEDSDHNIRMPEFKRIAIATTDWINLNRLARRGGKPWRNP